ncbi:hypothetical protein DYU11_21715 [Fibrisoma montanum]|uniref:Signal transduction histidine kinase internal region domain-containing protein n=1 Tax=Fibrisoma montanum TaxID=2305895 RepID=A0A418M4A2_9BACT|nr:histidine kinase [Fibrisoma montanum]RIV20656.1 hypothetical protein DYU11_21715 [Fibrisoma montanum]
MNDYNDTRLRVLGPIVLFLFGTIFFRLNIYFDLALSAILQFNTVALTAGYICWNLTRWTVRAIQRRFPGLPRTRERLLWIGLAFPLLVNFAVLLRVEVHRLLAGKGLAFPDLFDYVETTGIQIFYHCIYVGIYEGIYLYREWQQTYAEKEALLKAQWQSRFDSLKSQVNPHFLFNSLNSLSSLIADDPKKAETFVDEMSSVYRYLLQNNERELTTLDNELRFIYSYTHLLNTRYGKGISVSIDVESASFDSYLPPLTLQMLVENAVKHNATMPNSPLHIEIKTTGPGWLMVRNNLQRRTVKVLSNQVGLSNISARYRLLGDQNIVLDDDGVHFTVLLPLISQPKSVAVS